jgi:hypothetical protein
MVVGILEGLPQVYSQRTRFPETTEKLVSSLEIQENCVRAVGNASRIPGQRATSCSPDRFLLNRVIPQRLRARSDTVRGRRRHVNERALADFAGRRSRSFGARRMVSPPLGSAKPSVSTVVRCARRTDGQSTAPRVGCFNRSGRANVDSQPDSHDVEHWRTDADRIVFG